MATPSRFALRVGSCTRTAVHGQRTRGAFSGRDADRCTTASFSPTASRALSDPRRMASTPLSGGPHSMVGFRPNRRYTFRVRRGEIDGGADPIACDAVSEPQGGEGFPDVHRVI